MAYPEIQEAHPFSVTHIEKGTDTEASEVRIVFSGHLHA